MSWVRVNDIVQGMLSAYWSQGHPIPAGSPRCQYHDAARPACPSARSEAMGIDARRWRSCGDPSRKARWQMGWVSLLGLA